MNTKCQSCGMPIKGDTAKQGTHADQSKSELYCIHCYQHGAFTQPDINVTQMQALCISKMQEMGFPKPLAWLFTRNIPKLQRWAK